MVSLILPGDSHWPPDGGTVILTRPFAGTRPLRNDNRTQTLGASLTLTGRIAGVQTSLAADFSSSDNYGLLETGVDVERLQHLVDVENRDLYAPFDDSLLLVQRSRSRATNVNVRMNLQTLFLELPAGPLSWSFSANAGRTHSAITQNDNTASLSNRFTQFRSTGQTSVNLPISSRGSSFAALGDLAVDISLGLQSMAGSTAQTSYGGGMTWTPFAQIQLRGSIDRSQSSPTFEQLNGPIITTINRIFDYDRQEFVEAAWTTGGNPLLGRGSQSSISVSMTVQPLARQTLAINFGYRQFVAKNSPTAFPELTPAMEAAFPDRITRGAAGKLLAVDARAINIERQQDANLSSSIDWRLGGRRHGGSGVTPLNLAADRLQVNFALSYQLHLRSESLIRRGLPMIDRLANSGGSRHALDLRINLGKRAFGGSLSASWNSASRIVGTDEVFRLTPPLRFNLSSFANLDRLMKSRRGAAWRRGLKISLDVQNLFEGYPRVTLLDGSVPAGYSRNEADPLGRTVRLAFRKQF